MLKLKFKVTANIDKLDSESYEIFIPKPMK